MCKTARKGENPFTGEEPGKIFHEYPGVEINGYSTLFNACDTTAMFLIAHEVYQTLTGDKSLAKKQEKHIERAAIEILDEIRLINGGRITDYITETQVALSILSFLGLINLISPSKFNINSQGKVISPSIFLGLNYELTKGDLLSFRVDVESLGITRVNEVYQKLGIYGNYLSSLMDNLKKARQRIEVDLRRYFGLPYRIM